MIDLRQQLSPYSVIVCNLNVTRAVLAGKWKIGLYEGMEMDTI